jgi:hypothetical protein
MKTPLLISALFILGLLSYGTTGNAQRSDSSSSGASSEQMNKLQSIYVSDALPDFFKNLDTLNQVEPIFRVLAEDEAPNEADVFVFFYKPNLRFLDWGKGLPIGIG